MNMRSAVPRERHDIWISISNIVGIILCILFLPGFVVNITLLASSLIHPDQPPSFLVYTPLVVESNSMKPAFEKDDLVIVRNAEDGAEYTVGDIICFQNGNSYVTHRIVEITQSENGGTLYTTRGDANNTPDSAKVSPKEIIGTYVAHIDGLGGTLLYMQTPIGLITCVFLPILVIFLLFFIPRKAGELIARRREKRLAETAAE